MAGKRLLALIILGIVVARGVQAQISATDETIKQLQIKVKMFPNDFKSYAGLGAAYLQKGRETGDAADFELAKAALGHSLALTSSDPAAAFTMTQMAVVCMAEHRFREASMWAQKALDLGAGDPSPWAIAGDALADMGDYAGAAEAYSKLQDAYGSADEKLAVEYQRDSRMSYLRFIAGDPQDALRLMRSAVQIASDAHMPAENIAWSEYQLGEELFQTGEVAEAANAYLAALDHYPGYYRGLAGLAKARAAQGRYKEAADLYMRAIAVVPYPEYAAALGDVYQKLREPAKAAKEFELVEFMGRLSQINQQIHNRELALFYADRGRKVNDAVILARKELEVRQDIYTWDVLAWALYKDGQSKEAADAMSHALAPGTKDALLYFHAGMIDAALGDRAKAADFLRRALETNPHFSVLYSERASRTLAELQPSAAPPASEEARNAH